MLIETFTTKYVFKVDKILVFLLIKKQKALSELTIELLQQVHKQKPYIFDLL